MPRKAPLVTAKPPLGRDLPTPAHIVDSGQHLLLCLVGVRDGRPVYVPHNSPDDDMCPLNQGKE